MRSCRCVWPASPSGNGNIRTRGLGRVRHDCAGDLGRCYHKPGPGVDGSPACRRHRRAHPGPCAPGEATPGTNPCLVRPVRVPNGSRAVRHAPPPPEITNGLRGYALAPRTAYRPTNPTRNALASAEQPTTRSCCGSVVGRGSVPAWLVAMLGFRLHRGLVVWFRGHGHAGDCREAVPADRASDGRWDQCSSTYAGLAKRSGLPGSPDEGRPNRGVPLPFRDTRERASRSAAHRLGGGAGTPSSRPRVWSISDQLPGVGAPGIHRHWLFVERPAGSIDLHDTPACRQGWWGGVLVGSTDEMATAGTPTTPRSVDPETLALCCSRAYAPGTPKQEGRGGAWVGVPTGRLGQDNRRSARISPEHTGRRVVGASTGPEAAPTHPPSRYSTPQCAGVGQPRDTTGPAGYARCTPPPANLWGTRTGQGIVPEIVGWHRDTRECSASRSRVVPPARDADPIRSCAAGAHEPARGQATRKPFDWRVIGLLRPTPRNRTWPGRCPHGDGWLGPASHGPMPCVK